MWPKPGWCRRWPATGRAYPVHRAPRAGTAAGTAEPGRATPLPFSLASLVFSQYLNFTKRPSAAVRIARAGAQRASPSRGRAGGRPAAGAGSSRIPPRRDADTQRQRFPSGRGTRRTGGRELSPRGCIRLPRHRAAEAAPARSWLREWHGAGNACPVAVRELGALPSFPGGSSPTLVAAGGRTPLP